MLQGEGIPGEPPLVTHQNGMLGIKVVAPIGIHYVPATHVRNIPFWYVTRGAGPRYCSPYNTMAIWHSRRLPSPFELLCRMAVLKCPCNIPKPYVGSMSCGRAALCKNGSPYNIPNPYVGNTSCRLTTRLCAKMALTTRLCAKMALTTRLCAKMALPTRLCAEIALTTRLCAKMALTTRLCAKMALPTRLCANMARTTRPCAKWPSQLGSGQK